MKQVPYAKPFLSVKENQLVAEALRSTWISDGPFVHRFETTLARQLSTPHAISTSSGTTALHLALLALRIKKDDEVLVPGFAFASAANMILSVGAKPVWVDVDEHTWCLSPALAENAITHKTRALIVVHPYGGVADMPAIRALCRRKRITLIEDAAESFFSTYRGRPAGTWGDIGCFSFQATKTITTGEGGCVVTSSAALEKRMRLIRNHGLLPTRHYRHSEIGHNFRMTNIQAALGVAQLIRFPEILQRKQKIYAAYKDILSNQDGITLQHFPEDVSPAVWMTALRLSPRIFGSRDSLIRKLRSKGIETRPGFSAFSSMPIYKAPRLPIADRISAEVLSLPTFTGITQEEIRRVCRSLLACRKAAACRKSR
jgi:perosamine synthetase